MGPGSDEVDELRQEIDQTREDLGSAVGALAYKADVKNRGKEVIEDKKEVVMEKVDELKTKVPGVGNNGDIGEATPSTEDVKAKAQQAADAASNNPLAVAAGAAAVGLAAGLAIPETELERQKLKPHAQDARQQVEGKVHDTVAQVKGGVKDAVDSTADAVREQAQQQGGKIGQAAEKAADKTQQKSDGL